MKQIKSGKTITLDNRSIKKNNRKAKACNRAVSPESDGDELCTTYFTRHITLHLGNEPSRDALVFFDTFQLISKIV